MLTRSPSHPIALLTPVVRTERVSGD